MPPIEVPLKLKYRTAKRATRGGNNRNGNSGTSAGKHTSHPDVFAYRRNGYRCEPKWNVAQGKKEAQ